MKGFLKSTKENIVAIAFLMFAMLISFAAGNSLITKQALDEQRALYSKSLNALRQELNEDWQKHKTLPNGGS